MVPCLQRWPHSNKAMVGIPWGPGAFQCGSCTFSLHLCGFFPGPLAPPTVHRHAFGETTESLGVNMMHCPHRNGATVLLKKLSLNTASSQEMVVRMSNC